MPKVKSLGCLEGKVIKQEQQNISQNQTVKRSGKVFGLKMFNKSSCAKQLAWPQPQSSNWEDDSAAAFQGSGFDNLEHKAMGSQ